MVFGPMEMYDYAFCPITNNLQTLQTLEQHRGMVFNIACGHNTSIYNSLHSYDTISWQSGTHCTGAILLYFKARSSLSYTCSGKYAEIEITLMDLHWEHHGHCNCDWYPINETSLQGSLTEINGI